MTPLYIKNDQRFGDGHYKAIINTYLFFKPTLYLTQESFQSIRSIVFRPLFYVDINIFYDGSNDKTVICSEQISTNEMPSGTYDAFIIRRQRFFCM